MTKILLVGSIAGSIVNFRGDLIKAWIEHGCQVVTLSRPSKEARKERIRALGAVHREIPIERDKLNLFKDIKLLFRLRKILQEEKPDYIFAYTVKPVLYSALCVRAARGAKLYIMITGLGYAFAGSSLKQRLIKMVLRLLYRRAVNACEVVFFQNPDDVELFKALKIIADENKVSMINGSGVNLKYFHFSENKADKEVNFLLISRLIKSKGILQYVEAARKVKARYKRVNFKILGRLLNAPDSVDAKDLKDWQKEGIIEYLGGTEDVRPYIAQSNVYVLPSYYREGIPRSVLEAMSMGRPVITTDAPGCRETVVEGVNGYLVPVKDSRAVAEAMERFIEQPELIQLMGRESRRIAEERFDVHKVNRIILETMGIKV